MRYNVSEDACVGVATHAMSIDFGNVARERGQARNTYALRARNLHARAAWFCHLLQVLENWLATHPHNLWSLPRLAIAMQQAMLAKQMRKKRVVAARTELSFRNKSRVVQAPVDQHSKVSLAITNFLSPKPKLRSKLGVQLQRLLRDMVFHILLGCLNTKPKLSSKLGSRLQRL